MTDYQIPVSYVVQVSAVSSGKGLEPLQLGTILLLATDPPVSEEGLGGDYIIARDASAVSRVFGTESTTAQIAQVVFSQNPNILASGGYLIVAPLGEAETLTQGIERLSSLLYFEGIITNKPAGADEFVDAATAVEAKQDRILFVPASSTDAIKDGGLFTRLKNFTYTRKLLYTMGSDETERQTNAQLFCAAYASRLFAVNYSGSNTTLTMNLKDLSTLNADTNISETILATCSSLGVDVFPSVEGLAKVLCYKQNGQYADQVTNQIWFKTTIQRDVFNVLATTRTKIPQTEPGIAKITNTIREICKQGVTNGMLAPGTWNSADTFGDLDDFHRNISENGYYIYHQPVTEQSQSEREQRKAPAFQIAAKEAGAVHSANIMIYLEA